VIVFENDTTHLFEFRLVIQRLFGESLPKRSCPYLQIERNPLECASDRHRLYRLFMRLDKHCDLMVVMIVAKVVS
jgi:hypothetical protein